MFAAVLFGNLLNAAVRNKILKIVPIFMLILGALFILRGMEIGIPYISPKKRSFKGRKTKNANQNSDKIAINFKNIIFLKKNIWLIKINFTFASLNHLRRNKISKNEYINPIQ